MVTTLKRPPARWASESPLGFEAGDTNLHRYVGNSPPNSTDPSGMDELPYKLSPSSTELPIPWSDYPSYASNAGFLEFDAGKNTGSANFRNWLKADPAAAHLFLMKLTSQYYYHVKAASSAYDIPEALLYSFIVGENMEFAWNDFNGYGSSTGCGQLTPAIRKHYRIDIKDVPWRESHYRRSIAGFPDNIPPQVRPNFRLSDAMGYAPITTADREVFQVAAVINGMLEEIFTAAKKNKIAQGRLDWAGGLGIELEKSRPSAEQLQNFFGHGLGPLASILIELNGENPHATGYPHKLQPYEYHQPFTRFQSDIIYDGFKNGWLRVGPNGTLEWSVDGGKTYFTPAAPRMNPFYPFARCEQR